MITRQQRKKEEQDWINVAQRVLSGDLRLDRPMAEAVLIGLRHYWSNETVSNAVGLIAGMPFKGGSDGDDLVKRLVPDWIGAPKQASAS